MIEKRRKVLVDFHRPWQNIEEVDVMFDSEEMQVIAYRLLDGNWLSPSENVRFFPTIDEANKALEAHKQHLVGRMEDVKNYLGIMHDWFDELYGAGEIQFSEDDFLPWCYGRPEKGIYKAAYRESSEISARLEVVCRTGNINISGVTIRRDDVEYIKWGNRHAELVLKCGHTVVVEKEIEFELICDIFGRNESGTYYPHPSEEEDEDE